MIVTDSCNNNNNNNGNNNIIISSVIIIILLSLLLLSLALLLIVVIIIIIIIIIVIIRARLARPGVCGAAAPQPSDAAGDAPETLVARSVFEFYIWENRPRPWEL